MTQEISPREVSDRISNKGDIILIDVRTPGEYAAVHATPAVNIPLQELSLEKIQSLSNGKVVAFICKGGTRSKKACSAITCNSLSVTGGTDGWIAAGQPVIEGKGVISLERQVRIGAGILVLIGVLGSMYVHHLFVYLSGFVGAGLVFAGITDWCGMGLLLAKMPWNSRNQSPSCSA